MKTKFLLLNISYSLIEMIVILLFFYYVFGENIVAVLFVVGFYIVIFSTIAYKNYSRNPFGTETIDIEYKDQFSDYLEMIEKAKKISGREVDYKYIDYKDLKNPAFYHKDIVYINVNNGKLNDDYFEGMLAHELGHFISGFGNGMWIASLRISTLISSTISMIRTNRIVKTKSYKPIRDNVVYALFYLLSIVDRIILYPYYRDEEHLANDNSLLLTNGHSLRTYYFKVYKLSEPTHTRFNQRHPDPLDMIRRMEEKMNLSEFEKDVYHINNKVYYVDNAETRQEANEKKHMYYINVADKSNVFVLDTLVNNYYRGYGTKQDNDKALEYALKALELGSKNAGYIIGLIYEKRKEYSIALEYLLKVKEQGYKNVDGIIKRINLNYVLLEQKEDLLN